MKGTATAGTMREHDDNFSDLDLRCDFPARESFRESLRVRLLAINGQDKAASSGNVKYLADYPEVRELADSELEMLSAAGGDPFVPDELLDGSAPPLGTQ